MLSKGAIGNLLNRYRSVLKKCFLLNVFGSLAIATLMAMGGAANALATDMAHNGNLTTDVIGDGGKTIGGWNMITPETTDGEHASASPDMTITGGSFTEIIGGNHVAFSGGGTQGNPASITIGNTRTEIHETQGVQYVIGGSKADNAHVTLQNGETSLIINGGSNIAQNGMVVGGNLLRATGNPGAGEPAVSTAQTLSTTLSINAGTFAGSVVGGSAAFDDTVYPGASGTLAPQLSVTDGNTKTTITGGSFAKSAGLNAAIIGGGLAAGKGAQSTITGTASLIITGGMFNGNIHAGSATINGGTASVTNTLLKFQDNANQISGLSAVYGGGLDSDVSGTLTTEITGLVTGTPSVKTGIYGGSKAAAEGIALEDGNVVMTVSDATLCADVRGGGGAFGTDSSLTTKSSSVHVSNTAISGYESGVSIWTGRIFGAGLAQGKNAEVRHGSTSVIVENVTGVTYDQATGTLNDEDGARIYGGGQAYRVGGGEKIFVDSTNVVVKGEGTSLAEVHGGSIVSGTSRPDTTGLAVLGSSDISIENGTILDLVIGGNNTNWFGRSVVGKEDPQGTHIFNGIAYSEGSTKISISGGDVSQALVAGGSLSDYGWYYNQNGVRESAVFGTTDVLISGGKAGTVVGGGAAIYHNTETLAESGTALTDASPTSFVEGQTNVTVSGGEVENIFGGGFAQSNQKDLPAFANVTGDTTITVSGGTVSGSLFGGGTAFGEDSTANVTGNTNITISGGTVAGDIYAGGHASEQGEATVTGNANVTFLGRTDFANTVHGQGLNATVLGDRTLAFGTPQVGFTGTFSGTFDGFNLLHVARNSSVTLANGLTNTSVGTELALNGEGTVISDVLLSSGTIDIQRGELQSSHVDLSGTSAITVSGGMLGMAENGILNLSDSSTLVLEGGSANIYKDMILDSNYSALDGMGSAIVGTSGNLNILLGGAEYTATQYNQAKENLLGTGEDAILNFLDGNLKLASNEVIVIGGNVSGTSVTLDGVTPVVAKSDEAADDASTPIQSIPNQFVSVVEGSDTNKTLQQADSLEIKNSTFSAKGLQIAPTDTEQGITLTVGDGSSVTLVGGETPNSSIVVDESEQAVKTSLTVTDGGTLNLGITGNQTSQFAALAEISVQEGHLNVQGNGLDNTQHVYEKLSLEHTNASVNLTNATVAANTTELNDGTLNVLSSSTRIMELKATGGTLFVDPAYVKVDSLAGDSFGTNLLVGAGSVVEIGSIADLQDKVTELGLNPVTFGTGFTLGDNESLLALGQAITLGTDSKIIVDAGVNNTGAINGVPVAESAYFGASSLLVVDSSVASGTGAIKAGSTGDTITVKDGAKLLLTGAQSGKTYTITSGFADSSNQINGWTGSDLVVGRLIGAERSDGTNGSIIVTTTQKDAVSVFPSISIPNTLDTMMASGQNNTQSPNAGIRFLSRAMEPQFLADTDVVPTLDGAAQLSVAGGVQASALAVASAPARAVQDHLSLTTNVGQKGTSLHADGLDVWMQVLYGARTTRDFGAGSLDFGYDTDFSGVILGSDYSFELGSGTGRLGLALNVGNGNTRSHGDFNTTENDFDFWGISLYGGWNCNNVNLIADLGYSAAENELEQKIPASLDMGGRIRADVDSEVITAGVKGEYRIETSPLDIVPHAGVRYLAVRTDSFTSKLNEGDLFHTDSDLQHIWQFPIGVTLSKTFETESGWQVSPQVDLSVVPAVGDTKTQIDVRTPGINASDSMKRRIMDTTSFDGVFGVEVQKENVSLGLNYTIQASEHETGHGVAAAFMYKF